MLKVDDLHARRHARGNDQRTPGQRDRDRILYTSAFRRLGGITQVAAPSESYPIHTRLTHSLEVAQIGRRLTEKLKDDAGKLGMSPINLDADVVEAAALAHDLGHPPFGHIAEAVLDDCVKKVESDNGRPIGGFGGNAQSFRIVTKLAVRDTMFEGLNLSRATLNAILKYPWLRANSSTAHSKWGAYIEETEDFEWARQIYRENTSQSVEAQIMDWADDVAYAVHDMEDFYRSGFLPLERLVRSDSEIERFWEHLLQQIVPTLDLPTNKVHQRYLDLMETIGTRASEPFSGSVDHRAQLRSLTSMFIMRYILDAVTVDETRSGNDTILISIDEHYKAEVAILKQLTWYYVINRPSLATQQFGQRTIIKGLFEMLVDAISDARKDGKVAWILPEKCRDQLQAIESKTSSEFSVLTARIVADYISSMTENQCISLYRRLTGMDLGSLTDPVEI